MRTAYECHGPTYSIFFIIIVIVIHRLPIKTPLRLNYYFCRQGAIGSLWVRVFLDGPHPQKGQYKNPLLSATVQRPTLFIIITLYIGSQWRLLTLNHDFCRQDSSGSLGVRVYRIGPHSPKGQYKHRFDGSELSNPSLFYHKLLHRVPIKWPAWRTIYILCPQGAYGDVLCFDTNIVPMEH